MKFSIHLYFILPNKYSNQKHVDCFVFPYSNLIVKSVIRFIVTKMNTITPRVITHNTTASQSSFLFASIGFPSRPYNLMGNKLFPNTHKLAQTGLLILVIIDFR